MTIQLSDDLSLKRFEESYRKFLSPPLREDELITISNLYKLINDWLWLCFNYRRAIYSGLSWTVLDGSKRSKMRRINSRIKLKIWWIFYYEIKIYLCMDLNLLQSRMEEWLIIFSWVHAHQNCKFENDRRVIIKWLLSSENPLSDRS